MNRLRDKVILITGSAVGIGRSAAVLFASEGGNVSVVDIDQAGGEETVRMITRSGGKGICIPVDLTKTDGVRFAIQETIRHFGKLDTIYNNAGGSLHEDGPLTQLTDEVWEKTFSTNLWSTFLCCKYGIPELIKNGRGTIINTGSLAALKGWGRSAYTAAKGAIISLTRVMAVDYAKHNIRVNCICPHFIVTERIRTEMDKDTEFSHRLSALALLGPGEPIDVAYAALYLASDESKHVTGSILMVDSGFTSAGRVE